MVNFGQPQGNELQAFYNSFRVPQQAPTGAPQATQMQIPQTMQQKQPQQNGTGLVDQYLNGQMQQPGQPALQGSPLANYLAQIIQQKSNNSTMQSMGGFNNTGAQVGVNNINWGS